MLIFRSCSSFRRTCKSVALAARVMPSAYCTRPLIILFYIIWLVCAAAKGLISTIPITFVFCTCVAAYAIYDRRAHYMNVFYDLKHIHRTVTVEGDMLIISPNVPSWSFPKTARGIPISPLGSRRFPESARKRSDDRCSIRLYSTSYYYAFLFTCLRYCLYERLA